VVVGGSHWDLGIGGVEVEEVVVLVVSEVWVVAVEVCHQQGPVL